jgi:hypothetical protein
MVVDRLPQIGVSLGLEISSASRERDLRAGARTSFFPLWLEKTFGPSTIYGGGGYWINPGKNNQD